MGKEMFLHVILNKIRLRPKQFCSSPLGLRNVIIKGYFENISWSKIIGMDSGTWPGIFLLKHIFDFMHFENVFQFFSSITRLLNLILLNVTQTYINKHKYNYFDLCNMSFVRNLTRYFRKRVILTNINIKIYD